MENDRFSMRDIVAVAAGVGIGIVASRLLPPLLAQASGSVRHRMGEDPFERLIQDHRYIRTLLNDMENASERSLAYRTKLFLSLKRTLGKHALAEEDVVYPLLHDEVRDIEGSKHLYSEHADMKIQLYELEQMLMNGQDWSDRVRSLRTLIEGHIREEEETEFPKLRHALDDQRTNTLAQHIRREEALVL
jgi:hemerythrin superfamily protein